MNVMKPRGLLREVLEQLSSALHARPGFPSCPDLPPGISAGPSLSTDPAACSHPAAASAREGLRQAN